MKRCLMDADADRAPDPDELVMFVVYQDPRDYPPGSVVVRRWTIRARQTVADSTPLFVGLTVEGARAAILDAAAWVHRIERMPDDDPVIVEVWL